MGYPYGKDITYTVYPLADDAPVSGIPAQTATLYVFENRPATKADALAGTGAIRTATTAWLENATSGTFTIPAITEPSSSDEYNGEETYWTVTNLSLQAGEPAQPIYRAITLQRVQGIHQTLNITSTDLEEVYSPVTKLATAPRITAAIDDAIEIIKSKLKDDGYRWAQINRIDRVQSAVKYRALATLMLSLVQEDGGKYNFLFDTFLADYKTHLEGLKLEYDSYNTGLADVVTTKQNHVFVIR